VTDVGTAYVQRYADFFGTDALAGLTIGVYQHSAVGRDILVDVVTALGGKGVPIGRATKFIPVDTEAIRPEDVELAKVWARSSVSTRSSRPMAIRTGPCWPITRANGCAGMCWACCVPGR
jgi:hypothetical protein